MRDILERRGSIAYDKDRVFDDNPDSLDSVDRLVYVDDTVTRKSENSQARKKRNSLVTY